MRIDTSGHALACLRAISVYLVDPKDILTVSIWSHKMHEFSPYRPHYTAYLVNGRRQESPTKLSYC